MRIATRTGLAAFASVMVLLLLLLGVGTQVIPAVLQDRVDDELDARSGTAPIIAAVADRLARSELSATVEGARVLADGRTTEIGLLPDDPLPPIDGVGYSTASAGGERWRLLAIEVTDVPDPGDHAIVQLASPLGDVDVRARQLRRRMSVAGFLVALLAGLSGYLLGKRATRSLSALSRDAHALDVDDAATWRVQPRYGSPEVDEVAVALNASLESLAEESRRRNAALEAARAFASSATHELRTPLQSALTNLDIARSPLADDDARVESVELAHRQLQRMRAGLAGVRALADAEFADLSWFVPTELSDVVDEAVADEQRRDRVTIDVHAGAGGPIPLWRDGVRLAVANVVRNAILHGRRGDGAPVAVDVSVDGPCVVVDDDGPGFAGVDTDRMLDRFERGPGSGGSGLGLAIAHQVALAHGGGVELTAAPSGGARVVLRFGRGGS